MNESSALTRILAAVGSDLQSCEVEKWSTADEPFVIYWEPVTLSIKQQIQRHAKGNDQASSVYTLIFMAQDKDGNKLFTLADKSALMHNVPSRQIENIAMQMLEILGADEIEKF